jgi:uncharacterized membrane protein YraQ (UPF0718 family)
MIRDPARTRGEGIPGAAARGLRGEGIIPIVQALLGKGAALGTVLAFMMSVIALSLPEFIVLRNVLKPRLIVVFAGVVALGILMVGLIFNLLPLDRMGGLVSVP